MLKRKIEKYLEDYLKSSSNKMLILAGARQIGKSYIIRHVGKRLFPNYVEINMAEDSFGPRIFADAKTLDDFYLSLSTVAGNKLKDKQKTLIFIDEIQTYDHLLSLVKFLKQDDRFTYIASGSLLGVTLKETPTMPVGSITIKNMYPLDFEEFLWANGVGEEAIAAMESKINKRESLSESLHAKMMDLFKKYLLVGGLPDAVNSFISRKNIVEVRDIQQEIHHLYRLDAARYEQENQRKLKIQRIFEMIPSNLENKKKRVMAAKIDGKKEARMSNYSDEFEYLISAGIALQVQAVSKPSYPIVENSGKNLLKLYLNDVGIFTGILYQHQIQAIMNDIGSVNLGSVYEAVVAQELAAHGFRLCYYDNKKMGEVDFLIDDAEHLSVTPIEVKSGKDYYVHSALSNILEVKEYNISQAIVLNNDREIRTKNGITYLPVYSVMFLKNNNLRQLILE
ncbi:MAG: ATP-binding protein [Salinivirgaceae bacterium]|nr:ATP-binding protein [Salinivirgaceae bacterium]